MVRLIMLCGLPGSGKSTLAKKISSKYDCTIVSSDAIRKELYGDESIQTDNSKVFRLVQDRIVDCLKNDTSVIFDATNLVSKRRANFIAEVRKRLKDKSFSCVAIVISAVLHDCFINNLRRERQVPEDVIRTMSHKFQMPCYQEGFSHILIKYHSSHDKGKNSIQQIISYDKTISHDTQWHRYTVGKHEEIAGKYIMEKHLNSDTLSIRDKITLIEATFTHDEGKSCVKTFTNSKGEVDTNAHYYGHDSVGAYRSLWTETNGDMFTIIDRAILISNHMLLHHYLQKDTLDIALEKLTNKVGMRYAMLLYELYLADCYAH